jgi:hypothetical protein
MPTLVQPLFSSNTPGALWEAVLSARRVVVERRRLPFDPLLAGAREALLDALEAYAAGLVRSGRPIPYLLRDELRIQERTVRPLTCTEVPSWASGGTSGSATGHPAQLLRDRGW